MITRFLYFLIFSIGLSVFSKAQDVRLGIYYNLKIQGALVSSSVSGGTIYSGAEAVSTFNTNDPVYLTLYNGKVEVRLGQNVLGYYRTVTLVPDKEDNIFKVLPLTPKAREQWYDGKIEAVAQPAFIRMINIASMRQYMAGVVEAETGAQQVEEFYKVQAVIARTFYIANKNKHQKEGFSVCDQVHCQAHKGISRYSDLIFNAVDKTLDLVVVNRELEPIDAVFSSNCGGITHNSEDYWHAAIPYLRSTPDTFCLHSPHAHWELNLSKEEWARYLKGNYGVDTLRYPELDTVLFNYRPINRPGYLYHPKYEVLLRKVRVDWKVKSTLFTLREEGNRVILDGRGFGHGVGLCQEGAMMRAKAGQSYADILHHYFYDVYLVSSTLLELYTQK